MGTLYSKNSLPKSNSDGVANGVSDSVQRVAVEGCFVDRRLVDMAGVHSGEKEEETKGGTGTRDYVEYL